MNNYLIPANSKSGMLIFGLFRKVDLIIVTIGAVLSFILLLLISPDTFGTAFICLAPVLICAGLVIPVPNYHNILVVLTEMITFFYNRRNYKWEGWCYKDEYK